MVTFRQVMGTRLFIPNDQNDVSTARCGFIFEVDPPPAAMISLSDSWGRGIYVLFPTLTPSFVAQFAEHIRSWFIQHKGTFRPRIAWSDADGNILSSLKIDADNNLATSSVIQLGNFPTTAVINLNTDDGTGIVVSTQGRGRDNADCIQLAQGNHFISVGTPGVGNSGATVISPIRIEFAGEAAGALRFQAISDRDQLAIMGGGIRYSTVASFDSTFGGPVEKLTYPFLRLSGGKNISFDILFDANDFLASPLNAEARSKFSFPSGQQAVETWLLTAGGQWVDLLPCDGSGGYEEGRFVFMGGADFVQGDQTTNQFSLHLAPAGDFLIRPRGVPKDRNGNYTSHRLATGLNPTEYIVLPGNPAISDCLNFAAGPALDSKLHSTTPPDGGPRVNDDPLCPLAQTSWAKIKRANGGIPRAFSAQPTDLALYAVSSASVNPEDQTYVYRENTIIDPSGAFPMVATAGLETAAPGNTADFISLEQRCIALARRIEWNRHRSPLVSRQLILDSHSSSRNPDIRTPQGFSVVLQGDRWGSIEFGDSTLLNGRASFGIDGIDADLNQSLQQSNLCLVATTLGQGGGQTPNFSGNISIGGWTFSISLPLPGQAIDVSGSILILKYSNRPLADLISNPESWANPQRFAQPSPNVLQERLASFLKDLNDKASGEDKEFYTNVKSKFYDPAWNGAMVLFPPFDLSGLPDQIACLAAGFKQNPIAHHIGVDLTAPSNTAMGNPGLQHAGFFGLLDVHGDAHELQSQPEDNAFSVSKLAVLFANAQVERFSCTANLTLLNLFYEPVSIYPNSASRSANGSAISIAGSFESRYVNGQKIETYSFINDQDHKFQFSNSILDTIDLSKIQFSTVSVNPSNTKGPKSVETQFAITGSISFKRIGSADSDLLGISELRFDDLILEMPFNIPLTLPPIPKLELGPLRFDFGSLRPRGGLLKDLPLKFSFFQFTPPSSKNKLSDIGFFSLMPPETDMHFPIVPSFQFGLGFDLDLGSLGALASKLGGFVLKILVGWTPDGTISIGCKFDGGGISGGGLDLGIEGVLRVSIDSVGLEKVSYLFNGAQRTAIAVQLLGCSVDVLGVTIPEDAFNIYLFVDPTNLSMSSIGWLATWPKAPADDSPSIGIGQRIDALADYEPTSAKNAVDHVRKTLSGMESIDEFIAKLTGPNPPIKFEPSDGWFFAARTKFLDVLELDAIFLDPIMYGARVTVSDINLSVDVLYKKINDGLGMFAAEIQPPTTPIDLRHIDFGPFAITVPIIHIELYTDGGFLVDIGYPVGYDYSSSFSIDFPPFVGWGGIYLGRVNKAVVRFPDGYDPVYRLGFAARVGLGGAFECGPLSGGANISLFAQLEGAFAKGTGSQTYFDILGVVGAIAELYCSVDFGIVRALVNARLAVSVGLELQTNHPVILYIDGQVVFYFEFVIHIDLFFGSIDIPLHLEFHAQFHQQYTLGGAQGHALSTKNGPVRLGRGGTPYVDRSIVSMVWKPVTPAQLGEVGRSDLTLAFVVDVSLDDNHNAVGIPLLLYLAPTSQNDRMAPNEFDILARRLAIWAVVTYLQARGVPQPRTNQLLDWQLTFDDLTDLETNLNAGQCFDGLTLDIIDKFLDNNFAIHLSSAPSSAEAFKAATRRGADQSVTAIAFPIPPGLKIERTNTADAIITSTAGAPIDSAYQQQIDKFFDKIQLEFDQSSQRSGRRNVPRDADTAPHMAARIFQDWFEMTIRATGSELKAAFMAIANGDTTAHKPLSQLLDHIRADNGWSRVLALPARLMLHGLRLPPPERENVRAPKVARHDTLSEALYKSAGLQFPFFPANATPGSSSVGIKISRTDGATGAAFGVGVDENVCLRPASAQTLGNLQSAQAHIAIVSAAPAPSLKSRTRTYPVCYPHARTSGTNKLGRIYSFGVGLEEDLAKAPNQQLPLDLCIQPAASQNGQSLSTVPCRWLTLTELLITQVPYAAATRANVVASDGGHVKGVYRLMGADETNRRRLDRLYATAPSLLQQASLSIAKGSVAESTSYDEISFSGTSVGKSSVILLRTDQSIERRPFQPSTDAIRLAPPVPLQDPVLATLAESEPFIALVRRASIVNSGGTYLAISDQAAAADLDQLFAGHAADGSSNSGNKSVRVTLIVEFPVGLLNVPFGANALFVATADSSDPKAAFVVCSRTPELKSVRQPGVSMLRVYRRDPSRVYQRPIQVRDPSVPSQGLRSDEVTDALFRSGWVPKDADEKTKVLADSGAYDDQLTGHFSLFEYEVTIAGKTNPILVKDETLPISPLPLPTDEPIPLPSGVQPKDLRYDITLPLAQLIASDKQHPYAAIGIATNVVLSVRDIFGNRLQNWSYMVELTDTYADPIQPVGTWPGVDCSFKPATNGNSHSLNIWLKFDPTNFSNSLHDEGSAARLRAQLKQRYKTIQRQLEDPNLKITTICPFDRVAESHEIDKTDICNLVKQILIWVSSPDNPPNPVNLSRSINPVDAATTLTLPLTLSLSMSRPTRFVDQTLLDNNITEVWTVQSPVRPDCNLADQSSSDQKSLATFAKNFEQAIGGIWKVAVGAPVPGQPRLWLVSSVVIPASCSDVPIAISRAPLTTDLVSGDVVLTDGTKKRVIDADLETLLKAAMDAIEFILAPEFAGAAAAVSKASMTVKRDTAQDPFTRILVDKGAIANQLGERAELVFQNNTGVPDSYLQIAREALEEAMRIDLRAAYRVASVMTYRLDTQITGQWTDPEKAPKLYGKLSTNKDLGEFRLSTPGVHLGSDGSSILPVVVEAVKGQADIGSLEMPQLKFLVTHVERAVDDTTASVPGSSWLTIVNPVSINLWSNAPDPAHDWFAPIPSRSYPMLPTVRSHEAGPEKDAPANDFVKQIAATRRWVYTVEYQQRALQTNDRIRAQVLYNTLTSDPGAHQTLYALQDDKATWLNALTIFNDVFSRQRDKLLSLAQQGAGGSNPMAGSALSLIADALDQLKASLNGTIRTQFVNALNDTLTVSERTTDEANHTIIEVCREVQSASEVTPMILGDAGNAGLQLDKKVNTQGCIDWTIDTTGLVMKDVWQKRQLKFEGLDAVACESAWIGLAIDRNAVIGTRMVRPEFVYKTPYVFFGDAKVPDLNLTANSPIDLLPAQPTNLDTLVSQLLAAVVSGAQGTDKVKFRLKIGYAHGRLDKCMQDSPPSPYPRRLDLALSLANDASEIRNLAILLTADLIDFATSNALSSDSDPETGELFGYFVFSVIILNAKSEKLTGQSKPVVRMPNLRIPLKAIAVHRASRTQKSKRVPS